MKRILFSQKSLFIAILALLPIALWGCGASGPATPTATTAAAIVSTPTTMSAAMVDTPTAIGGAIESTPTAMGATMASTSTVMANTMPSESPTAGMMEQGGETVQQAATQDYTLTLRLGPVAMMLTPDQAQGATSGELMISGQMAMSSTDGMAPNYHLELAVNDIKSGAVITDKSVTIDLTNVTTNEKQSVPIATMYDVQVGPSDTHFGNNVALAPGNYTVDVAVEGEKATFTIMATAMEGTPAPMGTP